MSELTAPVRWEREVSCVFSYKDTNFPMRKTPLWPHLTLINFLNPLPPNKITLGVKVSAYESRGETWFNIYPTLHLTASNCLHMTVYTCVFQNRVCFLGISALFFILLFLEASTSLNPKCLYFTGHRYHYKWPLLRPTLTLCRGDIYLSV